MGSHKLIYFRTDGNSEIASGHLMRCVSIALACQALGMETRFLVSDAESCQLLSDILKDCGAAPIKQENHFQAPGKTDSGEHFPAEKADTNYGNNMGRISVVQLRTASYDKLEQELPEVISLLCPGAASAFCPVHNDDIADSKNDICTANSNDSADVLNDIIAMSYTRTINDVSVTNKKPACVDSQKKYHVVYLLDSYYVTENYLAALKPYAKTAYLDDLKLFDYPVDLLINYDVIPDSALLSYQAAYQKAGRLLLGAAYTPLRSQFRKKQIAIREQASHILVTTGGSDPYHFCLHFALKILHSEKDSLWNRKNFPHTVFHLVAGKLNKDKELLRQLAGNFSFLQLHEDVKDMASLMEGCDLAVSAAGTTLYELCALGIPAISFSIAHNQTAAAKAFDETGAIPWAGDLRQEPDKVFGKIADFLTSMCSTSGTNPDTNAIYSSPAGPNDSLFLRKTAQEAMHRLVDGKGASRIAQALAGLI